MLRAIEVFWAQSSLYLFHSFVYILKAYIDFENIGLDFTVSYLLYAVGVIKGHCDFTISEHKQSSIMKSIKLIR